MTYQYTQSPSFPVGMLPLVEISLYHAGHEMSTTALVDSGAMVSVLPYDLGLALGFTWEEQTIPLELGGGVNSLAYAVLVQGKLTELPPVALAFAWSQKTSDEIRVVLGNLNFFQLFDVHFYGHRNVFEIEPKSPSK
jgi:hypothetical protein